MTRTPRLLLADDHELVRATVAALLGAKASMDVTECADMHAALRFITEEGPYDLVLLDFTMPGMTLPDSLEAAIKANAPHPVAILSGTAPPDIARRAMNAGARGILSKDMAPETLVNAVRLILAGEQYAPPAYLNGDREAGRAMQLTPREMDVLRGICDGKANKEIARDLDVQEVTVKLHLKTLSRKLGARNRTHAAMIGRDLNLV